MDENTRNERTSLPCALFALSMFSFGGPHWRNAGALIPPAAARRLAQPAPSGCRSRAGRNQVAAMPTAEKAPAPRALSRASVRPPAPSAMSSRPPEMVVKGHPMGCGVRHLIDFQGLTILLESRPKATAFADRLHLDDDTPSPSPTSRSTGPRTLTKDMARQIARGQGAEVRPSRP